MAARLLPHLSYARLCDLGLLDPNELSSPPERMPRHDDEGPLGFSVFRQRLDDNLDLSDLSLPRTFFGRSEINRVCFRNTELRESNLCWNDFLGTDFTDADLARSDMRSSIFERDRPFGGLGGIASVNVDAHAHFGDAADACHWLIPLLAQMTLR